MATPFHLNDRVLTDDWHRGIVVQLRDDLTALAGTTFVVANTKYLKDLKFTKELWLGIRKLTRSDVVTWYPASALTLDTPDPDDMVTV